VQAVARAAARGARDDAAATRDESRDETARAPRERPDARIAEAIRAARVAALRDWKRALVDGAPAADAGQIR